MSKIFKELDELFKSVTIKPTFDYVHIILALFIFNENENGLGRYRLKEELLIGSGTAKSLITKLRNKISFISVLDGNIRKGHVLTEKGLAYLKRIKEKMPLITEGDISIIQEIIIDSDNMMTSFCQVKNSGNELTNGIAQRDAAIKVGGLGATCLVYDGNQVVFPSGYIGNDKVNEYFQKEIVKLNSKLEKNDVIIIGLSENLYRARLAAVNAALTLF